MKKATERIDILSFYWTLRDSKYEEAAVGAEIFQGLKDAAQRGIHYHEYYFHPDNLKTALQLIYI